jgi:hypothetical protein
MSLNADCISIFFTWIALGIVDFHVCVILVTKANAVKGGELHQSHDYIGIINPYA